MKDFLAEYWLWMAVPFLLVVGGLVFLYFWADAGDSTSPFVYDIGGGGN